MQAALPHRVPNLIIGGGVKKHNMAGSIMNPLNPFDHPEMLKNRDDAVINM